MNGNMNNNIDSVDNGCTVNDNNNNFNDNCMMTSDPDTVMASDNHQYFNHQFVHQKYFNHQFVHHQRNDEQSIISLNLNDHYDDNNKSWQKRECNDNDIIIPTSPCPTEQIYTILSKPGDSNNKDEDEDDDDDDDDDEDNVDNDNNLDKQGKSMQLMQSKRSLHSKTNHDDINENCSINAGVSHSQIMPIGCYLNYNNHNLEPTSSLLSSSSKKRMQSSKRQGK